MASASRESADQERQVDCQRSDSASIPTALYDRPEAKEADAQQGNRCRLRHRVTERRVDPANLHILHIKNGSVIAVGDSGERDGVERAASTVRDGEEEASAAIWWCADKLVGDSGSVGEKDIAELSRSDVEDQRLERMSDHRDVELGESPSGRGSELRLTARRELDILLGGEAHQRAVTSAQTALDRGCGTVELAGARVADYVVNGLVTNTGRHHQGCIGCQGQREDRGSCQQSVEMLTQFNPFRSETAATIATVRCCRY
jgi:hypothetical protein